MAVARWLADHPRVETVHYPGLASHPGHAIAVRQMTAFSGMLSFEVRGGREPALAAAAKTKLFVQATSLGGVESTLERRRRWATESAAVHESLVRLSVGIEDVDDLWDDLASALDDLVLPPG